MIDEEKPHEMHLIGEYHWLCFTPGCFRQFKIHYENPEKPWVETITEGNPFAFHSGHAGLAAKGKIVDLE